MNTTCTTTMVQTVIAATRMGAHTPIASSTATTNNENARRYPRGTWLSAPSIQ